MKVKFIGVPGERHDSLPSYGYVFPLGKPVEITQPLAMRKLRNHPHFAVVDDVEDAVMVPGREELEADAAAAGVKVDGRWSDDRLRAELAKAGK